LIQEGNSSIDRPLTRRPSPKADESLRPIREPTGQKNLGLLVARARCPNLIRHLMRAIERTFYPVSLRCHMRRLRPGNRSYRGGRGWPDRRRGFAPLPLPEIKRPDTQDHKDERFHSKIKSTVWATTSGVRPIH
jgi:hypothetical protein